MVLPNLSSQTLHALLTSNELWVPSEEKRFELALYTLVKKSALNKGESHEKQSTSLETGISNQHDLSQFKGKNIIDACCNRNSEADTVLQVACSEPNSGAEYPNNFEQPSLATNYSDSDRNRPSSSYVRMPVNFAASGQGSEAALVEGPSEESICCHFSSSNWLSGNDSRDCSSSSINSSCNDIVPDEWSRNELAYLWGGRTVGRRQVKSYGKGNCGLRGEEYDTFINIFEEGSVLYCNMSFEALLDMRKQLEELGFPCKAVNDGLWLQMLLSQRVQEIAAETCKNCCLLGMACACKQPFNFSHGTGTTNYYVQASDQNNNSPGNIGDLYVAGPANGEGNGLFRPVRVNVRGSNDGLAGIGRGATLVPASTWCPTRFVFSRVPFGVGNRNGQQSLANDDLELRPDQHGDMSGDGLTALVGLSDGGRNINNQGWQTESAFDIALRNSFIETSAAGPSGSGTQMGESSDQNIDGQ
uniref:Uncharacterized protein n=1 Tax=Chenopodium quinoa TaxID=63459 RepID=A0A803NA51_CHEQI